MSVRKRSWTTGQGLTKEAWVVDYVDVGGRRRLKTFQRKKEADAYSATTSVEVRQGTHIADSASATVREAGQLWLNRAKAAGLERSTIASYTQQLAYHIIPFIGSRRLSQLHPPAVRAFEDNLREQGRSPSMVRRVMKTLGASWPMRKSAGLSPGMRLETYAAGDSAGLKRRSDSAANSKWASTSQHQRKSGP